ncbi:MAG: hypothetical protein LBO21_10865 [Synergistaceae bacterium]|jgi:hypothetical protein|nr:hypothetical protein [Synergistaceae bacterium]
MFFCFMILAAAIAASVGLPVAYTSPPFGAAAFERVVADDGAASFVAGGSAFLNMDAIVSGIFSGDLQLSCAAKSAACLLSRTGFKLLRETPGESGDVPAFALKVYVARYLVSVSAGGKNVKNIPSNVKNWQYAIDPIHLEIV